MQWQEIDTHWKQFEHIVKYRWQELTNIDLHQINGNKAMLIVKLQERYKQNKEEADKSIDDFLDTFHSNLRSKNSLAPTPKMQTNPRQTGTHTCV